jgi:hypothetical protein
MVERGGRGHGGGRERTFNPSKDPSAAGARDHAEVFGIYVWAEEGRALKMGFSKFIVLKQLKSRT